MAENTNYSTQQIWIKPSHQMFNPSIWKWRNLIDLKNINTIIQLVN